MSSGSFVRGTTVTFGAGFLQLLIGIGTSVSLARVLGPEGRGIYALAVLLPSLIVTFANLGIGPATVYHVARQAYPRSQILGNNVVLGLLLSALGVGAGFVVVAFFSDTLFGGVPRAYLFLALMLVPLELLFSFVRYVLLGAQRIRDFNAVQIAHSILFLLCILVALVGARGGTPGAIVAGLVSWLVADILVLVLARKTAGGFSFLPNVPYLKKAAAYGAQVHVANILGFLNYRVDMFLVNWFLGPAAVGLYAVGVGLVEKLWLVSHAASTVLFPRVAAESDEERRSAFTPLVTRTVLWTTALGALVLILVSRWVVVLLYSEEFLPAVGALRALLVGVVALSAGRVVSNDLAGRGFPRISIYTGSVAVAINVALNILWIPRYGIAGAAWASTVSYSAASAVAIAFYCRLSGNRWTVVVFPQRGDWALYSRAGQELVRWGVAKVRRGFR